MTQVIAFQNLVKRYGKQNAVADLTASVTQGRITGFLGQMVLVSRQPLGV